MLLNNKTRFINNFYSTLSKRNRKLSIMAQSEFINIDGSYLEGGGQILRISTALSALLNKPIRVEDIRKGRADGGLKPQHLTGIVLISEICGAKLNGAALKSTEIEFTPTKISNGKYLADTKTAGSITLLLQNAIPVIAFGQSELYLRGGTHVSFSPLIDEFQLVFMPIVKKHFGIDIECEVKRKGYYPQGGGEVHVRTKPVQELTPLNMTEFGEVKRIYGKAFVAGQLQVKIAERMAATAKSELRSAFPQVGIIEIESVKEPFSVAPAPGTGLYLIAETTTGCILSSSGLGKRGVQAEAVGVEAARDLIKEIDQENCLDEHMQDQVIIFMALANGRSTLKSGPISLHTRTAIHYAQMMTGAKFEVKEDKRSSLITCEGIGFKL